MISSPYATQFTRQQLNGDKNPERNMLNRKALERPARRDAWKAREAAKNAKAA